MKGGTGSITYCLLAVSLLRGLGGVTVNLLVNLLYCEVLCIKIETIACRIGQATAGTTMRRRCSEALPEITSSTLWHPAWIA